MTFSPRLISWFAIYVVLSVLYRTCPNPKYDCFTECESYCYVTYLSFHISTIHTFNHDAFLYVRLDIVVCRMIAVVDEVVRYLFIPFWSILFFTLLYIWVRLITFSWSVVCCFRLWFNSVFSVHCTYVLFVSIFALIVVRE